MIVSVVIVFDLALAQPLLDLVGRHVPFLVAHDASKAQIWLMVLGLTIFIPVGLAGIALVVRRLQPALGRVVHQVILVFLVGLLVLRFMKDLPFLGSLSGWLLLLLAVAVGVGAARLFYDRDLVRSFFRIGAPLPIVVIGLFVFLSPASKILFPESLEAVEGDAAAGDVPVVMLVFDELPVASLMTLDGDIDAKSFPNFARLRADSTWFRNTTTVHDLTTQIVPAILDGRYPKKGTLPILSDHPDNLFTLLGATHRIAALEPVTGLCPPEYCGEGQAEVGAFASDLWVLTNHLVLPDDLKGWLPPLGDTWAGFAEPEAKDDAGNVRDPRRVVRGTNRASRDAEFLDMIASGHPGTLYFRHLLLPHVPWQYLPSGRAYVQDNEILGKVADGWAEDEWLVTQGYQRHLLQSQYADRVLGQVIEQLESSGLYDRALVIVMADHGITIAPGRRPRDGAPGSVGSVASVPLFVKRPLQQRPEVVDAPVETIDVVPTIVELLDIETDVDFDGRSLFGDLDPGRTRQMPIEEFEIDPRPDQMMPVVRDKYEMFGPALDDLFSIAPEGFGGLFGRRVDGLTVSSPAPYEVTLEGQVYEDLDVGRAACPCLVDAQLTPRPERPVVVAIAVNGVVAAITRTPVVDHPEVPRDRFYGMVDPERFRAGRNQLDFYLLEGEVDPVLRPIQRS